MFKNACRKLILNKTTFSSLLSDNFRLKHNVSPTTFSKMRFIQFTENNSSNENYIGVLSDDGEKYKKIPYTNPKILTVDPMINFIEEYSEKSLGDLKNQIDSFEWKSVNDITLLSPVTKPEKIICVGLNYLDHCVEQKKSKPTEPMFFSKYASTLVGPFGNVTAHPISDEIDWEVELAFIIGKKAKNVSRDNALDYVFGYSVAQDISARDWQKFRNGGQFLIGKSMDSFCPLGPSIVHKSLIKDPHNLNLTCKINDEMKQNGNTSNLIYRIDDIIWHLTQSMTLKPGDVILTGTPAGVGMSRTPPEYLKAGDVIKSEIEGVGKIVNKII